MMSIRKAGAECNDQKQQNGLAFDCYLAALRSAAQYAVELDESLTSAHCRYLTTLADEVASGAAEALIESRATFRGLLRDYRDKAARYLGGLRDELAASAAALQQILEGLSQTEGDHVARMRAALAVLRQAAETPEGAPLRPILQSAIDTVQNSLDKLRLEHQLTISQFQTEIRALHKRIDLLENAASLDAVTKLFTRREMEDRIRRSLAPGLSLLLIRTTGIRMAALNFSREVSAELAGAFTRRLRNTLPEEAIIGRWSEEEFIALTELSRPDAVALATYIAAHLAGSYACLLGGKTVRPSLELKVGVVDSSGEHDAEILQKIHEVFTG